MDSFSELITALQSDLNIDSYSSLYPLTTQKLAINRAYRKCAALFPWSETEDAKTTTTQYNIEYYDYPQAWISNSIEKLKVNNVDYGDPVSFKDFLFEKENNFPSGLTKMWANQWRRYFIYPTPTAAGQTIEIWGHEVVDKLVNDADVSIFSYSMPECNDAVVLEAEEILKSKGEDDKAGEFRSAKAKQILVTTWNRIKGHKSRSERTISMLDVDDMFSDTSSATTIGDFT